MPAFELRSRSTPKSHHLHLAPCHSSKTFRKICS